MRSWPSFVMALCGACAAPDLFAGVPVDEPGTFTAAPQPHTLFGRPNKKTGIATNCCMPSCIIDGEVWTAPTYTREHVQSLYSDWHLVDESPVLDESDFNTLGGSDKGFCAVLPQPDLGEAGGPMHYKLKTYESEESAVDEGAMVTHKGECGACSSLRNLAIYIANPDLTDPVRACSLSGLFDRDLSRLACIASLGFDLPCAQAWDLTSASAQSKCLQVCGRRDTRRGYHNKPYECDDLAFTPNDLNLLNDCLACDEVFNGAGFRAAAGRSRRGSGLPSAICRPCDGVYPVEHFYPVAVP